MNEPKTRAFFSTSIWILNNLKNHGAFFSTHTSSLTLIIVIYLTSTTQI